jgi:two-component system, cell cycle sensor histidine kinase and response regulator CckA
VTPPSPPDDRPAAAAGAPPAGAGTVLVVEDEAAVRRIVRRLLEQRGYRVLEATNGNEALTVFERHRQEVRLLVTDLMMPGVGGRELVARLRARAPALRVLFMSGYSGDAVRTHGELAPDTAFVEKPFTIEAFARHVSAVLAGGSGS